MRLISDPRTLIIQGLDETNQHAKPSIIIFILKRLLCSKAFFYNRAFKGPYSGPGALIIEPKQSLDEINQHANL